MSYARNYGRHALVIDADEVLEISPDFDKGSLTADAYLVESQYGGISYMRRQILRNDLPWRYDGVLHEHAVCDTSFDERDGQGSGYSFVTTGPEVVTP